TEVDEFAISAARFVDVSIQQQTYIRIVVRNHRSLSRVDGTAVMAQDHLDDALLVGEHHLRVTEDHEKPVGQVISEGDIAKAQEPPWVDLLGDMRLQVNRGNIDRVALVKEGVTFKGNDLVQTASVRSEAKTCPVAVLHNVRRGDHERLVGDPK